LTELFEAQLLRYVSPGSVFKNYTWCSRYICVSFMDLRTNSDFCLVQL